jgi:fused signal recognition particle receptor
MGVAAPSGAAVTGLWQRLAGLWGAAVPAARTQLERVLLDADFGPAAADALLDRLDDVPPEGRRAALVEALTGMLAGPDGIEPGTLVHADPPPTVVLVLGVNGVGKTTTVAKLAHRLGREGRSVLLAAADTYRAGAAEQLSIWAERLALPCVRGAHHADPASVTFDALSAAQARRCDTVLVDTAGRLHTEAGLLD